MEPTLLASETAEGAVLRLTLNRPAKRNALTRGLLADLLRELRSVGTVHQPRLVVLAAEGPVFCAGMDLAEMQSTAQRECPAELWKEDAELYREVVTVLLTLSIPTLAVVNGPVLAGGVGLVLACDLVLAADSASFALPEPQRGIIAAVVTPLLHYRLGAGSAGFLLLSGMSCPAERALRLGLVHELASAGELAAAEQELAASILKGAPGALSATKAHLLDCAGGSLREQLEYSARLSAEARDTDEAREGLTAFLEKRAPRWR